MIEPISAADTYERHSIPVLDTEMAYVDTGLRKANRRSLLNTALIPRPFVQAWVDLLVPSVGRLV